MAESAEILEASLLPADDGSDDAPEPGPRRRPPLVLVLAGALVLALAAAGALGWMLWHDHRTRGQADAMAVVEQYTAALDTHDLTGIHETLAEQADFAGGEHLASPVVGPFTGRELDDFYRSLFGAGVHLTTDGPMQVTGNGPYHVTVVQTVRYKVAGISVTEQALSLYTLLQLQDRPVILEHVWWRPLAAQAPSMLWAQ